MSESYLEKQFRCGKAFAIPAWVIAPREEVIFTAIGKNIRPRSVQVEGYEIDAYIFPGQIGDISVRKTLFEENGVLSGLGGHTLMECRVGDRVLPIVVPSASAVEMVGLEYVIEHDSAEQESMRSKSTAVGEIYRPFLVCLSQLTGWKVVYHYQAPIPCAPCPDEPKTVHLLIGTSIPGESDSAYRLKVFGRYLHEKVQHIHMTTGTKGRGIILYDPHDEGKAVLQLVGNNAYVLFPVVSFYHGLESQEIFKSLLALLWRGLREREQGRVRPPAEIKNHRTWVKAATAEAKSVLTFWDRRLKTLHLEIGDAQRSLESLYGKKQEIQMILQSCSKDNFFQEVEHRLPQDWRRLRRHPLVERLFLCDAGLHVETKLISLTYEGETYDIGRFLIRFGLKGTISMWPIETRHLAGIPHPHISLHGIPCFGTASSAIAQATGEWRVADAIELVLRWLSTGYADENAENKIQEWMSREQAGATIDVLEPLHALPVGEPQPLKGATS